jgi:cyclic pyranopterin phosphate synthase
MNDIKYNVLPSLSLNITDQCNFDCIYCPPHGENFIGCKTLCDLESVSSLIKLSTQYNLPVIRLTGGEPLIYPDRVQRILETCQNHFGGKIILNTNGSLLQKNIYMLKPFRYIFLLKISFDTLSAECFYSISRPKGNVFSFDSLLDNILVAKDQGFKIELNSVVNKLNASSIMDVIEFSDKNEFDIKLFGVNSFNGIVNYNDIHINLNRIIDEIEKKYQKCIGERLPGDRGIQMLKYRMTSGHFIWIVDHSEESNYNKQPKIYSSICKKCTYYPCVTGRFSITLRADGLLQGCRMHPEEGKNISGLSYQDLEIVFESILKEYRDCEKK